MRKSLSITLSRSCPWVLLLLLGAFCLPLAVLASPSLSVMEEARSAELVSRLTPLAEVLERPAPPVSTNHPGSVLLNEVLVLVDPEGRRTLVQHLVYKALTDAAVQALSEEVVTYSKKEQRIYLLKAETVQPDGSTQQVRENAILIQSPQRQAEYSLYDDQAELKVIYPNIKKDSLTHLISVVEDIEPRIRGEFCYEINWGNYWPVGLVRRELILPAALESRLKQNTLGNGVPKAQRSKLPGGDIRLVWQREACPGVVYERQSPPQTQVGPLTLLSTLRSWDDIGLWYSELMRGRDQLSPELAALVDTWTASAKSPEEILAVLHSKIANDVRYVGLEFGTAAYQPHDCNEVWTNQYGDCKDKSNLLVAMLRHKGIKAHLSLVNTESLGLVDRRSPSYRVFNHAIVCVQAAKNKRVFCDPTIAHSTAGMLGTGTLDREALVITERGAEWARIPAGSGGTLHFDFDLQLKSNGELAGWLKLRSGGSYGASYRHGLAKLALPECRSRISELARGFFPGAEITDIQRDETPDSTDYVIRSYFVVPAKTAKAENNLTLRFPVNPVFLRNYGDQVERRHAYFLGQDLISTKARVKIPKGYAPVRLPAAWKHQEGPLRMHGSWELKDSVVSTSLEVETTRNHLSAAEFAPAYKAAQSLNTWLAEPLVLARGAAAQQEAPADEPNIDLPLMPTGDGQIQLVDQRYPEEGRADLRRLALERTLQYYPDDPLTAFRAGVRIAVLDWQADKNQQAHERVAALLARHGDKVNAETKAWAEYVDALMLRDCGRIEEALACLEKLRSDKGLSDERRADAAVQISVIRLKEAPAPCLALLSEISVLPRGSTPPLEAMLLHALLLVDDAADLEPQLARVVQSKPDVHQAFFAEVLARSNPWTMPGDEKRLLRLVEALEKACPAPNEKLRSALDFTQFHAAARLVKIRVQEFLASPLGTPFAFGVKPPGLETLEHYNQALQKADDNKKPVQCLKLALAALASLPIDEHYARLVWRAATYADWAERTVPKADSAKVTLAMLDLCELLPEFNDFHCEGRTLRAIRARRLGAAAEEREILSRLATSPRLPSGFVDYVARTLCINQLENGLEEEVVPTLLRAEPLAGVYGTAADAVFGAVLALLDKGDHEQAERLLERLSKVESKTLAKARNQGQLEELLALHAARAHADYRARAELVWKDWLAIAESLEVKRSAAVRVIPVYGNCEDLRNELQAHANARRSREFFEGYDLLASAARWQPSAAASLGLLLPAARKLAPQEAERLTAHARALLQAPVPASLAAWKLHTKALAQLETGAGEFAKALTLTRTLLADKSLDAAARRELQRQLGRLSLSAKLPLSGPLADLEVSLAQSMLAEERVETVELLAQLLAANNEAERAEALVVRELDSEPFKGKAQARKRLGEQLEQLQARRLLAGTIDELVAALGLSWFKDAPPADLGDQRIQDLDTVLLQPYPQLTATEHVKLLLLVGRNEQQPMERRQRCLREAVRILLAHASSERRLRQIADAVIANQALPVDTRTNTLWNLLVEAALHRRAELYNAWRKHELCARFNTQYQSLLAVLDCYVASNPLDAASLAEAARKVTSAEVGPLNRQLFAACLCDLLMLGEVKTAETLVAGVGSWTLGRDLGSDVRPLQLEHLRLVRQTRTLQPLHAALRRALTGALPDAPAALPAAYDGLFVNRELPLLSKADTRQACLYLLHKGRFDRSNLNFWGLLLESLNADPGLPALVQSLFAAATAATKDDAQLTQLAQVLTRHLDLDNADVRAAFEAGLLPLRAQAGLPLLRSFVRSYDAFQKLREGRAFDPALDFPDETNAEDLLSRLFFTLHSLNSPQRRDRLQKLVDAIPAASLLHDSLLGTTLPVFEELGMEQELGLARETAEKSLSQCVMRHWVEPLGRDSASALYGLVRENGLSTRLPENWLDHVLGEATDPFVRHKLRLAKAWNDKDWPALERAARAMTEEYPTHYTFYWDLGLALHEQGKDADALAPLGTYVAFAKDERMHARASDLLRRLKAGPR